MPIPSICRSQTGFGASRSRSQQRAGLVVPLQAEAWLADCRARMEAGLERLGQAVRAGTIHGGSIENGVLKIDKLPANTPFGVDDLILDLCRRIPDTRITTILSDVDDATGLIRNLHPLFRPSCLYTLPPDGRISCSQANTGGQRLSVGFHTLPQTARVSSITVQHQSAICQRNRTSRFLKRARWLNN